MTRENDIGVEPQFRGLCIGVGLENRGPRDLHQCVAVYVEDDGNWICKMNVSSQWLEEMIENLQEARDYLNTHAQREEYGWTMPDNLSDNDKFTRETFPMGAWVRLIDVVEVIWFSPTCITPQGISHDAGGVVSWDELASDYEMSVNGGPWFKGVPSAMPTPGKAGE